MSVNHQKAAESHGKILFHSPQKNSTLPIPEVQNSKFQNLETKVSLSSHCVCGTFNTVVARSLRKFIHRIYVAECGRKSYPGDFYTCNNCGFCNDILSPVANTGILGFVFFPSQSGQGFNNLVTYLKNEQKILFSCFQIHCTFT